jgi:hypothetical protein
MVGKEVREEGVGRRSRDGGRGLWNGKQERRVCLGNEGMRRNIGRKGQEGLGWMEGTRGPEEEDNKGRWREGKM